MVIYLLPEFNMTISAGEFSKKMIAGNIYCFTLSSECVFSVHADSIEESWDYSFLINNKTVEGGKCNVLILSEDELFIQLLPIEHYCINNWNSCIYMFENNPCIVNVFQNQNATAIIQYKDIKIIKKLFKNNYKINIFEKQIKNNSILFICLENSIKKYFLIINKNKILFNNYLKEINLNDNLIILDDNINCLGEKTVFEYNFEKNTTTKYAVKYKSKNATTKTEIKFLDAVKVFNEKLMKECLGEELKDVSLQYLQEFLGEYDDFLMVNNHYLLVKNGEVYKSLNIEIKDDLITDICE